MHGVDLVGFLSQGFLSVELGPQLVTDLEVEREMNRVGSREQDPR
jgi:hypothetical protein